MIIYKFVDEKEIDGLFLKDFNRYQVTYKVKYLENKELKEKDDFFIEAWDEQKLNKVSLELKENLRRGGKVVAAYDKEKVIAFACLSSKKHSDGYLNLTYIHVTREYRNKGIGKQLFLLISKQAKKLGARKLYISAHPNIDTIAFYQNMGCVLAEKVIKELYDLEPLDIQLEKNLD